MTHHYRRVHLILIKSGMDVEREQLSANFFRDEFSCKCNCGADQIDPELISKLQKLRNVYAKPMVITSGVRCCKHNSEIPGASKFSAHILGLACDFKCTDSSERWKLIDMAMKIFPRVGLYDGWIHVDIQADKPQQVLW